MKITLIGLFTVCILLSGNSQYYYPPIFNTGTHHPYNFANLGTTILSAPNDDVLSDWQALPFEWSFFELPVIGYYASDNGYITFDQSATTSVPPGSGFPPSNAIFAFWDSLELWNAPNGIAADKIRTFNYGEAPNRTHVISWYHISQSNPSGYPLNKLFFSIHLHECGDFDIVWNSHIGQGGSSLGDGSFGWNNVVGDIGFINPPIVFPEVETRQNDDMVWSFHWNEIQYDAAIIPSNSINTTFEVGYNSVNEEIRNNGSTEITSYDLHYSVDGGLPQTLPVSGISIPPYSIMSVDNSFIPYNFTNAGVTHNICVWIDNLNGLGSVDELPCNDTLCYDVFVITGAGAPVVNVVVEEFTGTWCPFCPAGTDLLNTIVNNNTDNVFPIAIHYNDLYETQHITAYQDKFNISFYPSAMIDRSLSQQAYPYIPLPANLWESEVTERLAKQSPVIVEVQHTFDPVSREIQAMVSAEFVDFAQGDFRFVLAITEDSIIGIQMGQTLADYRHDYVLRAMPSGVFGNFGVIPYSVVPSTTYSESFSYILPLEYEWDKISIIGFVAEYGFNQERLQILNAARKYSDEASGLGVEDNELFAEVEIYPNPAKDKFKINLQFKKSVLADIKIYNASGQEVSMIESRNYLSGQNEILVDTYNFDSGLYFVSIKTENQSITRSIVIE